MASGARWRSEGMKIHELKLPDLAEGEIVAWHVKVGDLVKEVGSPGTELEFAL